jgi:hypothetical protein
VSLIAEPHVTFLPIHHHYYLQIDTMHERGYELVSGHITRTVLNELQINCSNNAPSQAPHSVL